MHEIVSLAQQADVRSVSCAQSGKGFDVIELEKRAGIAASPSCRDERALATISTVGFSPQRDG
jgi:hypothetical protein